jgi:hypothetical protein
MRSAVGLLLLAALLSACGGRSADRPPQARPAPLAAEEFPSALNTGVPAATVLTTYTGPSTIKTCGTVIDGKLINGGLDIRAGNGTRSSATPCVTIQNSRILGTVDDGYNSQHYGPLVVINDEIVGTNGDTQGPLQEANIFAWRLNIHGGRGQFACDGYCELHDSFIHDAYFVDGVHYQAFESNGAFGDPILIDHNTLICRFTNATSGSGGCASDISFFGDDSSITNVTVKDNLFKANPDDENWCVHTGATIPSKAFPTGTNLVWTGNTFERGANGKCGGSGVIPDWAYNSGNVWQANKWDDGTPLNP